MRLCISILDLKPSTFTITKRVPQILNSNIAAKCSKQSSLLAQYMGTLNISQQWSSSESNATGLLCQTISSATCTMQVDYVRQTVLSPYTVYVNYTVIRLPWTDEACSIDVRNLLRLH